MTLRQWFCRHIQKIQGVKHSTRRRAFDTAGRLGLVCDRCGHRVEIGMDGPSVAAAALEHRMASSRETARARRSSAGPTIKPRLILTDERFQRAVGGRKSGE